MQQVLSKNKIISSVLLLVIVLLPFSDILLPVKDMWHSQGAFFQLGILLAFSLSFFIVSTKPLHQRLAIKNIPLTLLTLYLGLMTCFHWNKGVGNGVYNFLTFMPFFNFLIVLLMYKLIVVYLDIKAIKTTLKIYSYTILIVLGYCVLQYFNLDQFHKHFSTSTISDPVIGCMGNPSHLAGYLTMCLPILYYRKTILTTIGVFLCWAVIIYTGSASGLAGALLVTIFYNLFFQIRFKHEKFLYCIILGLASYTILAGLVTPYITKFLNPSGRYEQWGMLYPVFQQKPILGGGLGILTILKNANKIFWSHAHNEFYQIILEGGIIALGIVVYGIKVFFKEFWQKRDDELSVCLASVFVAFLFNSIFNWPAHLWITSTLAMFSYAGLYVMKGERIIDDI